MPGSTLHIVLHQRQLIQEVLLVLQPNICDGQELLVQLLLLDVSSSKPINVEQQHFDELPCLQKYLVVHAWLQIGTPAHFQHPSVKEVAGCVLLELEGFVVVQCQLLLLLTAGRLQSQWIVVLGHFPIDQLVQVQQLLRSQLAHIRLIDIHAGDQLFEDRHPQFLVKGELDEVGDMLEKQLILVP